MTVDKYMSKLENQSIRTNFAWIFLKDWDRILLIKKKSNGNRGIPGGHLDTDETYTQCILREAEEELWLKIEAKNLSNHIIAHCINKKDQKVFLWRYVLCEQRVWKPINNEPDKCSKISRYHTTKLPEDIPQCTQKVLEALLDGEHYIEIFT